MNPEMARHGSSIRGLREELGFTPERLAEHIGVSAREVRLIEDGAVDHIKVGTLRAYADLLGSKLSISAVLGDERVRIG